ncbi:MAG: phage tail protein I [Ardenticatenaceae bacterium]|nr:phage tail protein I [Ardenticatenaceae bacterium]
MTQQIITHRFQIRGPQLSFTFTASEGKTAIGRHSDNNLVFTHPLVSRSHAQLICTADSCTLIDLGSTHGTFVNQERLEANAPLRLVAGMVVEIGAFRMVYDPEVTVVDEPEKPDIPEVAAAVEEPETAVAETPPPPLPAAPVAPAAPVPPPVTTSRAPDTDYVDTVPFTPVSPPPGFGPPRPPASPPPTPASNGHFHLPPGLSLVESRYLQYLPDIYWDKENTFIPRFLALLESILAPIEWNIDNFYLFLDPRTAPLSFLPWLANWFEITFDGSWDEAQMRTLLQEAHQIYRLRGTSWALSRVLEIYTGVKPEIDDTNKNLAAYTFSVHIPLRERQVNRAMIEHIIDVNKPAHTSYTLIFKE